MDSATATAAGEKPIIFQAIARVGKNMGLRNIWLIIRPTRQEGIFETFKDIGPPEDKERFGSALLGISSIFVKSSLYAVGGRKPNSYKLSSCIRCLDTKKPFEGWKVDTLPFSSFDSVLGVYGDSIYILPGMWKYGYYGMGEDKYRREQRGYIWSTTHNECLPIRIRPPEDGGESQWRRIRACASLDEGLLIAMDGEKNNFFFYRLKENDWEIYDQLPAFIGETSFAASSGRLYILEVPSVSPAFLYIYDIKERKLVMDKVPITKFDDDLWSMDEWDRVVRLVSVADDKLCFLWLGPVTYESEDMWRPVRILHYLTVKFSINPNPSNSEVMVEDDNGFHTNITNLLDCLPCDPQQFEAELKDASPLYRHLDAFQNQQTDNSSAEEIGTRLISGKQFQNQGNDIASPIEKVKRKRTQLVDPPLSRHEQKSAKDKKYRSKKKAQMAELKEKLEQLEKDSMDFWFEAHLSEARLKAEVSEARLKAEVSEARLKAAVREAKLEAEVRALKKEVRDLKWEAGFQGQIREVEKHQNRFDKLQVSQGGEWGKNEEPSSTIYETVSPSEVPRQQHVEAKITEAPSEAKMLKAQLEEVTDLMKAQFAPLKRDLASLLEEVGQLSVEIRDLKEEVREMAKHHNRFDTLRFSLGSEWGKNEEPSSSRLPETVGLSEVPEQQQILSSIKEVPPRFCAMASTSKKITLKSSDGETFEVEEAVAVELQTIKHMIEDGCADGVIPLPKVTSKILSKVLEYCKKHVDGDADKDKAGDDELKAWDAEFVKVDHNTLHGLILAANYLEIKSLLDLTGQTVADVIKGKTPADFRKTFNSNLTPEERRGDREVEAAEDREREAVEDQGDRDAKAVQDRDREAEAVDRGRKFDCYA